MQWRFLALAGLCFIASNCGLFAGGSGHSDNTDKWPPSPDAEVTGEPAPSATLTADVFIDGTSSMQGFAKAGQSRYSRFIQDLDAALTSVWPASDVRYFKFGSHARQLANRNEFQQITQPAFYTESGLAESTDIDKALASSNPEHLTIIVTDLFEEAGDVNALDRLLKTRFLTKNAAVGLLAVPSEFDGVVYDARVPPFAYRTTGDPASFRPFYALIIGRVADVDQLVSSLSQHPYISRELFTLAAGFVASTSTAALRQAKNLADVDGHGDSFRFNDNAQPARLSVSLNTVLRQGVPVFDSKQVEMVAEEISNGHAVPVSSLRLAGFTGAAPNFTAIIEAAAPLTGGTHVYHVTLKLPERAAFPTPSWVKVWHADSPSPANNPNHTMNLEPFVNTLLQSSTVIHAPTLARVSFRLTKRRE